MANSLRGNGVPSTADGSAAQTVDPTADGVVETTLLLPFGWLAPLESAANRQQTSVGRLVRELIRHHLTSHAESAEGWRSPSVSELTPLADGQTAGRVPNGICGGRHGVLVVDDTAAVRELLTSAFRADGLTVWQATDGREAEVACRVWGDQIGLILMDVQMPLVTGPDALAAIHRFAPAVACWFMSGDLGKFTEAGLIAGGADRVLSKPFRIEEVRAMVGEFFRSLAANGR